ncbi:forkhead protein FKH [Microdochium nivale]|nr:forkhead protein FKH [Microdochium nivale]
MMDNSSVPLVFKRPSSARLRFYLFVAAAVLFVISLIRQTDAIPSAVKTAWNTDFSRRPTFYEIAMKHGTDKVTDHQYHFMYEKYMPALRDKKLKMLEIGLGCNMGYGPGHSYHTWLEYFPNVDLYYIEYDAECAAKWASATTGATIFTGDQADVKFLNEVIRKTGGNFDIIIDDGGHTMHQQQVSLEQLWKAVTPGGIYFLEDLQTSFMAAYGGDVKLGKDTKHMTMLKYIYEMIDDKILPEGTKHAELTSNMRGIECQREVCAFFKKGPKDEPVI